MINEEMFELGDAPNKIRELYAYGLKRAAQIGQDKVFDLSIGNPSVPAPQQVDEAIADYAIKSKGRLHPYTPSPGLAEVREAIAANLNRRFGTHYGADNLYLSAGASAALAICCRALTLPGEEFIVISPYFPEYRTWIENAGAVCVEVPAASETFQLDLAALEAAINVKTAGIIINTPNNPVGSVYDKESLEALAALLRRKSEQLGHTIYLVSDEPYREIVYDQIRCPWVPSLYEATLVCYSWSKSMSLPGERIGYVLVPDEVPQATRVYKTICGAGRALGYICDSVMIQKVVARCIDAPVNIEPYAKNRDILTEGLSKIGYTYIQPQGAFYLWVKALEEDAGAFSERAKDFELLLVPSDCFFAKGWVRIGYCTSSETLRNSLAAFQALFDAYQN